MKIQSTLLLTVFSTMVLYSLLCFISPSILSANGIQEQSDQIKLCREKIEKRFKKVLLPKILKEMKIYFKWETVPYQFNFRNNEKVYAAKLIETKSNKLKEINNICYYGIEDIRRQYENSNNKII